ncbi:MAG TPA: ferritin-like domain-containing protein [Blastocatellia bacterium]|nr:ferritin-like domain-containing protein [Blastocatellia bacterium]
MNCDSMMMKAASPTRTIDIKNLAFDQGAHLLIKRALADVPVGEKLEVRGRAPELAVHLRGWCRAQGHDVIWPEPGVNADAAHTAARSPLVAWVVRGSAIVGRWRGAEQAGRSNPFDSGAIIDRPPATWGLAARGAKVEAGGPQFHFGLSEKEAVWADSVPRLYAQAAAAQWDPATAINWNAPFDLPPEVESAVVQVMTYLIENENAALLVPARFLAQIHPHFREVMQLLAIQVADEARHVEVFTRRATLRGGEPGLSTVSGQESLKTLLDEPDFSLASFLLSVLGEGTFLNLLWFLEQHAPDLVTRQVAQLAAQDEARHVAFGVAHLQYQISRDPATRLRLAAAIDRRYTMLSQTAGLNEEVYDALILLAAGAWTPEAIADGFAKVQQLKEQMDTGRRARLIKLGFPADEAAALSSLHTRNFM